MARTFKLANGYSFEATDVSTPARIVLTLDSVADLLTLYSMLTEDNLLSVTVTEASGKVVGVYLNRVFGSINIETKPNIFPVTLTISLTPPPFVPDTPSSEEIERLKHELQLLRTENAALSEKANAYDIVTGGE